MLDFISSADPGLVLNAVVLLAIVGAFLKWVWPVLRKLVHAADKLERFEQVERDVIVIKSEVTYNNGGSLKDAVRRVEQGQASQDAQLERLQLAVFHNGPTS